MLGYVLVGTNDLERAKEFYDRLFDVIGARRVLTLEKMAAWGIDGNQSALAVTKPHDGQAATAGNGTMIAIPMKSREIVNRFHAKALELGGKDEGAPGVRGVNDGVEFYAAYFRDPDGNKLAAASFGDA